ncbi:hypothetical protein DSL72_005075 [Monilinia vaccinii-corymbosi]|uniref:Uncharacterized protein n=1 Tax=Monilinia vaccinii-corymbosi TaxID=61207 RepID=A0A8A3PE72_9HELO|nr:hypothetical protein DSL72_005075 [Monilinia vaccinii-corymbosi]
MIIFRPTVPPRRILPSISVTYLNPSPLSPPFLNLVLYRNFEDRSLACNTALAARTLTPLPDPIIAIAPSTMAPVRLPEQRSVTEGTCILNDQSNTDTISAMQDPPIWSNVVAHARRDRIPEGPRSRLGRV